MNEDLLRRIKKLLAIAEDHRADPNEAAAAAGMAQRLMAKYQLEHQDIVIAALKEDLDTQEFMGAARKGKTYFTEVPIWISTLAVAVARLNSVEVRTGWNEKGACIKFYGYKDDTLLASWTMTYLVGVINALCKAFRGNGMESGISYRRGVSQGICSAIKELVEARKGESTGRELVVAKEAAISDKYGSFSYSKAVIKASDATANSLGYQDGRKVDLNVRGITTEGQLQLGKS